MKDTAQLLNVHQLKKKFQKHQLFEQLSFSLNEGEWLGVIGKNGVGKSTLASIIVGIEKEFQGEVFFQNKNQKDMTRREWVQQIQLISQYTRNALDPSKTVLKLLEEPLKQFKIGTKENRQAHIIEVLSNCHLPESILKQKPRQISGGQYQRVCIAQALLVKPKLLICDEITANLDKINELRIIELLKQNRDLTVLFISHDRHLIDSYCDRYLQIEKYATL